MTTADTIGVVGLVIGVVSGVVVPIILYRIRGPGSEPIQASESRPSPVAGSLAQPRAERLPRSEIHAVESPGFYVFLTYLSPISGILSGRGFMQSESHSCRKVGRYILTFGLVELAIIGVTALVALLTRSWWAFLGGGITYVVGWSIIDGTIFYNTFCNGKFSHAWEQELQGRARDRRQSVGRRE